MFIDKKKKGKSANLQSSLQFYGMIKSQHLCKGMACLPFQKDTKRKKGRQKDRNKEKKGGRKRESRQMEKKQREKSVFVLQKSRMSDKNIT